MSDFVSKKSFGSALRLGDDAGAAGTEWVVAAAIVVLFSIPVLTLINSGSGKTSQEVVVILEDPNGAKIPNAYAPTNEDEDGGAGRADDKTAGAGVTGEATMPGLNKGVGYDISVEEAKGGKSFDSQSEHARQNQPRYDGNAESNRGDGRSSSRNNSDNTDTMEPSKPKRRLLVASGVRRDKPSVKQTEVARRNSSERGEVNRDSGQNTGARGNQAVGGGQTAPNVNATAEDVTCSPKQRAKFIERRHEFDVGAGLDEELFMDSVVVEDKRQDLFTSDEIRIIGDEDDEASVDCEENRALVTAAGEQLGDGTILGMVTISASSDNAPSGRSAPLGLGMRPTNPPVNTNDLDVDGSALASGKLLDNDATIQFVAFATGNQKSIAVEPAISFAIATDVDSGFSRLSEAAFSGEVNYVPLKSSKVNRSGR